MRAWAAPAGGWGAAQRSRLRLGEREPGEEPLHEAKALAHHEGAAGRSVRCPVSKPCRAPVLDRGVALALIDRELRVHLVERHHLNPCNLQSPAVFIGVADESKALTRAGQRIACERLVHFAQAVGCDLLSAEDSIDEPSSQVGAGKVELVGREWSGLAHM
jgi:hypothetical protein